MPSIIERLIDSEAHAVEAAVPAVAEEAADALQQAKKALQTAKTLIAEAMASHIYDADNGERPQPGCAFAAGIVTIDQALIALGPQTPAMSAARSSPTCTRPASTNTTRRAAACTRPTPPRRPPPTPRPTRSC